MSSGKLRNARLMLELAGMVNGSTRSGALSRPQDRRKAFISPPVSQLSNGMQPPTPAPCSVRQLESRPAEVTICGSSLGYAHRHAGQTITTAPPTAAACAPPTAAIPTNASVSASTVASNYGGFPRSLTASFLGTAGCAGQSGSTFVQTCAQCGSFLRCPDRTACCSDFESWVLTAIPGRRRFCLRMRW